MTKFFFFAFCSLLIFTNADCKKDPITPIDDLKPGRRDYVWTVDTLKNQNNDLTHLFSLWGSTPTDIWAVGQSSSASSAKWHYDGMQWKNDNSRISNNLRTIFGFSTGNIWAGDSPGMGIYRFDGNLWTINYSYNDFNEFIGINNIWGEQLNDIYAVGSIYNSISNTLRGVILHFNGYVWQSININFPNTDFLQIRKDKSRQNNYYLSGNQFLQNKIILKGYKFNGKEITEIYSSEARSLNVNEINNLVYFTQSGGNQILKYSANNLQVWKDFSNTDFSLGLLWGRSEKDIFTQAFKSGIYGLGHFNGDEWVLLYPLSRPIDDVMVFDTEIFILTNDIYPIIIHGKLKQL